MPGWLQQLPIERVDVLVPAYLAAAALVALLLVPVLGVRGDRRRRVAWTAAAAGAGAVAGWLLIVWVVDVQDVFGVPASTVIRAAATATGAAIGVAAANLPRSRWWRRALAVVAVPVFAVAGSLMINRDVAYYPRLGDVVGDSGIRALVLDGAQGADRSLADWRAPAGMPAHGTVGTVRIPGTQSQWHARDAWVYLPPAARVRHPPRLPVVVAFSGEPGSPSDVFLAGGLQARLDALAARHRGVAPIVVVPDQLGAYAANPMCLDSPLGHVATYVLQDVRGWILQHLPVSSSRREWTVAGFSQGATCAVQFATEHSAVFGSFIAVSPELGPVDRSVAHTVAAAFHGDRAAYAAAMPIAIMRRTGHYRDTAAVYSVGGLDRRYGAAAPRLAAVSKEVGMRTSFTEFPQLAHNWNTGAAGLSNGLAALTSWWRLP